MIRIFSLGLFFACFCSQISFSQDCKLEKDKDYIKVYTCRSANSKFKIIRSEVIVPNATCDALVALLKDVDNYVNWQYNMVEANILKKISNNEMIYRTVVDLPWPVDNRELIARLRITRDSLTNGLIIKVNATRHDYPVRNDLVRIPYSEATWTVTPHASGNGFTILYTLQVDPGGSVPAWLINMAVAEGPFRSFKNLRAKVQEIALKK